VNVPEGLSRYDQVDVFAADALDMLRQLPDGLADAVVTDPPYGLADHKPAQIAAAVTAWVSGDREHVPDGRGFMGRAWDAFVPPPAVWDECLRVLKPGGHLLCFAGTRTVDLMGLSIRLAGFEIRDSITWHHGQGFPKNLDVSKAIDRAAGAEPIAVGPMQSVQNHNLPGTGARFRNPDELNGARIEVPTQTAPATDAAREWAGWGTALKPASEPIIVARKPLVGTVAANVLEHGTGAINVDACRVTAHARPARVRSDDRSYRSGTYGSGRDAAGLTAGVTDQGRWPANVVLSHGPECNGVCQPGCPVAELDAQSGNVKGATSNGKRAGTGFHANFGEQAQQPGYNDQGGASRFFPTFRYQAKAPTSERPKVNGKSHPTVKPLALMRWLVRLVTPPGGLVLDPFAGSGTTGQAAALEGMRAVLIEADPEHIGFIHKRLTGQDPTPSEQGRAG